MSRRILKWQLRVGRWWCDCKCWPLGCLTYSGDSGEPGHSRFGNLGNCTGHHDTEMLKAVYDDLDYYLNMLLSFFAGIFCLSGLCRCGVTVTVSDSHVCILGLISIHYWYNEY